MCRVHDVSPIPDRQESGATTAGVHTAQPTSHSVPSEPVSDLNICLDNSDLSDKQKEERHKFLAQNRDIFATDLDRKSVV